MINVNYNNWNKYYQQILNDFQFSQEMDEKSAQILEKLVRNKASYTPSVDKCIIFGAGPSIKKHIMHIKKEYDLRKYLLIAADGATTALLEEEITPHIIVTDLDGNIDYIINANRNGSILYIHAHGDNIGLISKYVPQLENIIPTTQSQPTGKLENYGGFTDGDRAIHIAVYKYHMKTVILAGMDFDTVTTKYSRPNLKRNIQEADEFKKHKLKIAEKLVDSLIKNNPKVDIINLCEKI